MQKQSLTCITLTQREKHRRTETECGVLRVPTYCIPTGVRRDRVQNLKGISGEKSRDAILPLQKKTEKKKKNIPNEYCFVLFLCLKTVGRATRTRLEFNSSSYWQ